jgi:hypothetical protein
MADIEGRQPSEAASESVADVTAREVTIRQGGARSITAQNVLIRQGGAGRVEAEQVQVSQGGVALASTKALGVTAGGIGAAIADRAELTQTWAQVVVARNSVNLDQAATGLVVSKTASARDSVIGLLLAREFQGEGVRVLMGPGAAFAFGAGLGVALALLGILRRRH